MMTIGEIFKTAREKKKITTSEAAVATRMKVQHVEAIESGRFDKFAAPTYARGFIRLYAEYLGLDPSPLIRFYNEHYLNDERPSLIPDESSRAPAPKPPRRPPSEPPVSAKAAPTTEERKREIPAPARPARPRPQINVAQWRAKIGAAFARMASAIKNAPQQVRRRAGFAAAMVALIIAVPYIARCTGARAGKNFAPGQTHDAPKSMSSLLKEPPEPFLKSANSQP